MCHKKYNDDGTLNEDYLRYFSDDWRDELEYRAEIRREVEALKREEISNLNELV